MAAAFAPIFYVPTDEEVHSGVLGQHLRAFNYQRVGEYPQPQPVRLNVKDADGALLGGLRAFVAMHWLRIDILWVAEAARGQGLGSQLLAQAEAQARTLGAIGCALETFDWQAPGFYRKHGYEEAGRIDHYIAGRTLFTMTKRFAAPSA